MKKLLMILGSLGVVASSAATVVACDKGTKNDKVDELKKELASIGEMIKEQEKSREPNAKGLKEIKQLIEKFQNIKNNEEAIKALAELKVAKEKLLKTINVPENPEIIKGAISKKLNAINANNPLLIPTKIALNEVEDQNHNAVVQALKTFLKAKIANLNLEKLTITIKENQFAKLGNDVITLGNLKADVKYNDEVIKADGWSLPYASEYLKQGKDIIQSLEQGIFKEAGNIKIPDSLPMVGGQSLNEFLKFVGLLVDKIIPTKIPTNFSEQDSDYKTMHGLFDMVKSFANEIWTKEIKLELNTSFQLSIMGAQQELIIKGMLKTSLEKIVSNIMPVIINFKNFINNQPNKDLISNLLKYIVSKPTSYNDDGYGELFENIKDNKDKKVEFKSNFEAILFFLLEGWKDKDGKQITQGQPLEFYLNIVGMQEANFAFFEKTIAGKNYIPFNVLIEPSELIKIIFGLAAIQENSVVKATLLGGAIRDFELPIGKLLGSSLIKMLLAMDTSANFDDHVQMTLDKFEAEIQVLHDKNWTKLTPENLQTAEEMRIIVKSVAYTLKDNEGQHPIKKILHPSDRNVFEFKLNISGEFLNPKK
ncbi:lipoprotein [Williamsoniiplasma lucivorax]|uniref:Lipoprotein n=1 Tax=Williamsoniiplasma lucivorax TaxID=209274 RepID=A0A2S5RF94_9MOLU|nr:lipoprotein [Williamsoniiplasma lucivorax]PPE05805.1 hypothetical protein ELUCI_v1c00930 [Williamsoniiplasma lucivorax]